MEFLRFVTSLDFKVRIRGRNSKGSGRRSGTICCIPETVMKHNVLCIPVAHTVVSWHVYGWIMSSSFYRHACETPFWVYIRVGFCAQRRSTFIPQDVLTCISLCPAQICMHKMYQHARACKSIGSPQTQKHSRTHLCSPPRPQDMTSPRLKPVLFFLAVDTAKLAGA